MPGGRFGLTAVSKKASPSASDSQISTTRQPPRGSGRPHATRSPSTTAAPASAGPSSPCRRPRSARAPHRSSALPLMASSSSESTLGAQTQGGASSAAVPRDQPPWKSAVLPACLPVHVVLDRGDVGLRRRRVPPSREPHPEAAPGVARREVAARSHRVQPRELARVAAAPDRVRVVEVEGGLHHGVPLVKASGWYW